MAVQTFRPTPLMPEHALAAVNSGTLLNNSTQQRLAVIFQADKTGSIDRIWFRGAVVTTSQSVTVSIQSVDANFLPSGSVIGGTGTQATIAATTNYEVTLSSSASVTAGTWYAVVVEWTSTQGSIQVQAVAGQGIACKFAIHNGTSWARSAVQMMFTARYTDNSFTTNTPIFVTTATSTAFAQNTAGSDEYGLLWTPDQSWRLAGVVWYSGSTVTAGGLPVICCYDNGGSSLGTISDGVQLSSISNGLMFATPIQLTSGTPIRLTVQPSNNTSVSLYRYTFPNSDLLAASPWGSAYQSTKRVDLGSWTDESLILNSLIPIVSGINVTSGGLKLNGFDGGF